VAPARHQQLTGAGNERVLATLRRAAEVGKLVEVRTLLVPSAMSLFAKPTTRSC